jgi:hypothetical protein
MLRDNLVGLIEPMRISAGVDPLALNIQKQASDDRSSYLENPRPEGAESSLTENVTSPFQAEPAQFHALQLKFVSGRIVSYAMHGAGAMVLVNVMRIPCFGRRMTIGRASIIWPGAN